MIQLYIIIECVYSYMYISNEHVGGSSWSLLFACKLWAVSSVPHTSNISCAHMHMYTHTRPTTHRTQTEIMFIWIPQIASIVRRTTEQHFAWTAVICWQNRNSFRMLYVYRYIIVASKRMQMWPIRWGRGYMTFWAQNNIQNGLIIFWKISRCHDMRPQYSSA